MAPWEVKQTSEKTGRMSAKGDRMVPDSCESNLSFVLVGTGSQCYTSETRLLQRDAGLGGGANEPVFLVPLWTHKTLVGETETIPQEKGSKC